MYCLKHGIEEGLKPFARETSQINERGNSGRIRNRSERKQFWWMHRGKL